MTNHGNCGLTPNQVRYVRTCKKKRYALLKEAQKYTDRSLAEDLHVSHRTINRAASGETYVEVK